jgi:hypothetical protein
MLSRSSVRIIAVLGFCVGLVLASALPVRGQSDREDTARPQRLGHQAGHLRR